MNDARGKAAVAGRADTHDGTTVRAGRVRHEADHPAVEALAHHTQSERAPGLRPCRVPVINGPALKIGPTVFLGIEQAAGLSAISPRRRCRETYHLSERLPSNRRVSAETLARFWQTRRGQPGTAFFFSPRLPLVAGSHTHLLPLLIR